MISYVNAQRDTKNFWLYNPLLIFDYVSITRKNEGRIGTIFWVFLVAIIILFSYSFLGIGN
jgi:hypothetical protein